ncbi:MAG: ribosomal-processing cysteine protease Prp [Eubacterium sp.]|nr:ribosomal-processing cysteine protease Prp [Eubacterium sp.]
MISITIYKSPEGSYQGFQVIGHADSVDEGADLVCCSVSVLTINTVNSIEAFTSDSFGFEEDDETGLVELIFDGKPSPEAELLMKSYEMGVLSIADEYDTWLNVITKEV